MHYIYRTCSTDLRGVKNIFDKHLLFYFSFGTGLEISFGQCYLLALVSYLEILTSILRPWTCEKTGLLGSFFVNY